MPTIETLERCWEIGAENKRIRLAREQEEGLRLLEAAWGGGDPGRTIVFSRFRLMAGRRR